MTEPTTPQLSEAEVADYEKRRYAAVRSYHSGDGVNWFLTVAIPALIRDWKAMRAERDEAREWLTVAKGNITELQSENATLREQLARLLDNASCELCDKSLYDENQNQIDVPVCLACCNELQSQLAQVTSERDALRDSASLVAFQAHQIDGRIADSLIEQGARLQREADAKLVESYHECPSTNDYNIAAAIRANVKDSHDQLTTNE